ncbi:hypothetical protein [Pandoraea sp. NPDC087047]|uniref:hypothetical protein n=1 Tax=Pandoraea sp. NPDC087047 TaxID=3364390 RepID=UPI0038242165
MKIRLIKSIKSGGAGCALVLWLVLAACTTFGPQVSGPVPPEARTPPAVAPSLNAVIDPAAQLEGWYNRTDQNCGTANRPAFLCSGVMLRATETNPAFLPWDPSPDAIQKGGISFSWLRTDSGFSKMFHNPNGFVVYPDMEVPSGTQELQVYCAFPLDADTWRRPTDQGCGPLTYDPVESRSCEVLGITTAQQWVAHFDKRKKRPYNMCAWNVRIGQQGTADRFYQNIRAEALVTRTDSMDWNELIIATWATGIGTALPIQSFFYLQNVSGGLVKAQTDQQRYFQAYGKFVPIVRIGLPANSGAKATFVYTLADQVVAPPDDSIATMTPKVLEASANNGQRLLLNDFYSRDFVTIEVPVYPGMSTGQTVGARWRGPSVTYDTPIHPVTSIAPVTFQVPRVEVIDAIGTTVPVSFTVKRGNNPIEHSAALNLQIEAQVLVLPAPTINAGKTEVTVSFPGALSDQTVQVRWAGVVVRDTVSQYVDPGHPNVFAIPSSWVTENAGKPIAVNYAVGTRSGTRYQFSKILRINP